MRIAYFVGVHDRFDAVPRATAQIGQVDLLIVGGDITTVRTPGEAAAAIGGWRPLAPRLLAPAQSMPGRLEKEEYDVW